MMRTFEALRGVVAAACLAASLAAVVASTATATPLKVCVPEKEGGTIKTPKAGACATKYKLTELGGEGPKGEKGEPGLSELSKSEQERLKNILTCVTNYEASGVGGKPTLQISGCNVQILSGTGSEEANVNGAGNLIIGYDEHPGTQTGSNNLVIGSAAQTYTSFGAIVGGQSNLDEAPYGAVFGLENRVKQLAYAGSVSGGYTNFAEGLYSSVSGGEANQADGNESSVSGGRRNNAEAPVSSVDGGSKNMAQAEASSILGGGSNKIEAAGKLATIIGEEGIAFNTPKKVGG
jgi:hypothetical protein